MIAPGGERILGMRQQRQRPGEGVVISLVGPLNVEWLVRPDPLKTYDWLWAVDLDVWIVAATTTDQQHLRRLIADVRKHRPKDIRLWLSDVRKGYDLWFYPTVESVVGPPDRWVWVMDAQPMSRYENEVMAGVLRPQEERLDQQTDWEEAA